MYRRGGSKTLFVVSEQGAIADQIRYQRTQAPVRGPIRRIFLWHGLPPDQLVRPRSRPALAVAHSPRQQATDCSQNILEDLLIAK